MAVSSLSLTVRYLTLCVHIIVTWGQRESEEELEEGGEAGGEEGGFGT